MTDKKQLKLRTQFKILVTNWYNTGRWRKIRSEVEPLCDYSHKRGWWCSRARLHPGPCAARPKWWNLKGLADWSYNRA